MASGVNKIQDLPKGERYGAAVVSYNRYPTDPDGRGATSPVPVSEWPPTEGKNDTAANVEYSASKK